MNWALLGRFFGVPLAIVTTVVAGAVMVVLLFGGPAAPQTQSIDNLLQALEASGGERSAGILLPREKELWQTALELSERLRNKSTELAPEQVESIAERLAAMTQTELDYIDRVTAFGENVAPQKSLRSARFEFLLRALSRTQSAVAVPALVDVVNRGREPYVGVAIQELANLHTIPQSNEAVAAVLETLRESARPETLLAATTAISVLASRGDPATIDALSSVRLANDGEVAWSAALALARLGSDAGKSTLIDMLDRSFWESGDRYQVFDEKEWVMRRYPMPPNRVDALLIASIEAAASVDDHELWSQIEALQTDRSHPVRGAASKAVTERKLAGSK